ncbi:hypothetical protein N9L26_00245 [Candidatus Pacebacteria bacterium]|nr:hypothetical protein [Candidatus Paceibacterota bacterium]
MRTARSFFMIRKLLAPIAILFVFQLVFADAVNAGFGITPPYVRNTSLTRNSTYEQQILLVRSDPKNTLKATVSVDAPEFLDWIEIVDGNEFLLPAGEQKVPMTVRITVPGDADFTTYEGNIRIKTGAPDGAVAQGAVSISLGAQVDIDLTIIDREILDFRVRKIDLGDLNEGHKVGWLYFPGKIRFNVLLENTGNVDVAPSRIVFKIYDSSGTVLLEETEHTNRLDKIEPFGTGEIEAHLPTRLPAASYLARYQIFNGEEIKQEGELTLSVLPYGTLQVAGYGVLGLSWPHKISIVLPLLTLVLIAGSLYYTSRRRRTKSAD